MSKYPKGLVHISEEEKLKLRLQSTYEERFVRLLGLIALQKMLNEQVVIIKKPKMHN